MGIGQGKTVTIVGAGLAGALLASSLAKLGFRVNVYERRGDPRRAGYSGGRSINLALSARGLWGLERVGLDKDILKHAIPMRGRMVHPAVAGAGLAFQPYSKDPGDAINSISRGGLNMALLDEAEKHDNVELFFNQRCLDVDMDHCRAVFQDDSNGPDGPIGTIESDLIIGTDGAFSAVRLKMMKSDRFEYSQTYLTHGYKELHIPPVEGGAFNGFAMDPSALHIWPRGSAMMIALPNIDKSFTCTLFWPFTGEHSFDQLRTAQDVEMFFKRWYPDAMPIMPTLVEDFLKNPTSSLVTVRCWPWVQNCRPMVVTGASPSEKGYGGRAVALMGDAAHAIVPFFGQGMNAAFEDVRVLCECLERHAGRSEHWLTDALDEYQALRKPNADAIARMAIDNFEEMRDKVGSRLFRARKKAEHLLHELMPGTLVPKYNLVSFSTVPYAEALRRGARLDRVLRVLILLAALIAAALVLAFVKIAAWYLLVAVIIAAWFAWDRWRYKRDTTA
ncbi:MAG: FAD-dependent monooxygenase [Phycisphaerales bacterium]|nr:FAD-dependent monooxygenase [Phycisphaerales bacterium]